MVSVMTIGELTSRMSIRTCRVRRMGAAPPQGEALHALGQDGARRAKRWLESTSRVDACWVDPDKGAREKLTVAWPQGGSFSFDLGGRLRYSPFDGQLFFAEVKNHTTASNLNTEYDAFLAKCYVTYLERPTYADHFLWLSWTPHGVSRWASLTSAENVQQAVITHAHRIFPADSDPDTAVDLAVCQAVAERLWILILSRKQEDLVPTVEHLGIIHAHEMVKAHTAGGGQP